MLWNEQEECPAGYWQDLCAFLQQHLLMVLEAESQAWWTIDLTQCNISHVLILQNHIQNWISTEVFNSESIFTLNAWVLSDIDSLVLLGRRNHSLGSDCSNAMWWHAVLTISYLTKNLYVAFLSVKEIIIFFQTAGFFPG